jgi:hypothetical protein
MYETKVASGPAHNRLFEVVLMYGTLEWTFGKELTELTPQPPPTAFSNTKSAGTERKKDKNKENDGSEGNLT